MGLTTANCAMLSSPGDRHRATPHASTRGAYLHRPGRERSTRGLRRIRVCASPRSLSLSSRALDLHHSFAGPSHRKDAPARRAGPRDGLMSNRSTLSGPMRERAGAVRTGAQRYVSLPTTNFRKNLVLANVVVVQRQYSRLLHERVWGSVIAADAPSTASSRRLAGCPMRPRCPTVRLPPSTCRRQCRR